jgi:hypothetical protein
MPDLQIECWFSLMCSELRSGSISEDRFVSDCSSVGIPLSRIESFIKNLKKEDGIKNGK